jgi:hypothetical protein
VLGRVVLTCLVLTCATARAQPQVRIHATCAAELARDPAHVRALRGELARALGGLRTTSGHTLDVSLVEVASTRAGRTLEVRAELRAMLSDARGHVRWASTSRATVRGSARDRAVLERDAVTAAARDVARSVRAHTR